MRQFKTKTFYSIIIGVIIFSIIAPILFLSKPAKAQWLTTDLPHIAVQVGKFIKDFALRAWDLARENMAAIMYKNFLNPFLTQFASETATFIGTFGKEGKPLFFTDENYFEKLADTTAAGFLDQIAKDFTGQGLCEEIDPTIKLSILLSLPVPKPPEVMKLEDIKARCSLSDIKKNLIDASRKEIAQLTVRLQEGPAKFSTQLKTMVDAGKFAPHVATLLKDNDDTFIKLLAKVDEYGKLIDGIIEKAKELEMGTAGSIFKLNEAELNKLEGEIGLLANDYDRQAKKLDEIFKECSGLSLNDFCPRDTCKQFCPRGTVVPYLCDSENFPKCQSKLREDENWYRQGVEVYNNLLFSYSQLKNKKLEFANLPSPGPENILSDFQKRLSPEANPLGKIGILSSKIQSEVSRITENKKFQQLLRGEWKVPETAISGVGLFPAGMTEEQAREAVRAGTASEKIYTGVLAADVIGVFANTLMSKLQQSLMRWGVTLLGGEKEKTWSTKTWQELFQKAGQKLPGTTPPPPTGSCTPNICVTGCYRCNDSGNGSFYDSSCPPCETGGGSPLPPPKPEEIRAVYADVLSTPLKKGEIIRLVDEFAQCPSDPRYALPNHCVIDTAFAQAIDQELTIEEAMKRNLLHPDWYVGSSDPSVIDSRRDYSSRYSLTNAKILARAGIMPLGFQIAAEEVSKLGKKYTLKEIVDSFNQVGKDGKCGTRCGKDEVCGNSDDDVDESPFCNLVNPKWRLKAPTVLCEIMGYTAIPDPQSVERQEACLQWRDCTGENDDGTCHTWNYCTAYKNSWRFSADRCEPQYDSCQSYTRAKDGAKFAWLEKTLDYGDCDANSIGCTWYCKNYDPKLGEAGMWSCTQPGKKNSQCNLTSKCTSPNGCDCQGRCLVPYNSTYCFYEKNDPYNVIFFNRSVETCQATAEGCSQFIRTKEDLNTNLLPNGSFEIYKGTEPTISSLGWEFSAPNEIPTGKFTFDETKAYAGKVFAEFTRDGLLTPSFYGAKIDLLPENKYTIILFAKNNNSNSSRELTVSIEGVVGASKSWELVQNSSWQFLSYEFPPLPAGVNKKISDLRISSNGADVLIDNVALIAGSSAYYSEYGSQNIVYLKKAPDYLACYNRDSQGKLIKNDDDAACLNFVKGCNQEEVGCEKYTPITGEPYLSAVAKEKDKCPAECVGYNSFREMPTDFYSSRDVSFIPKTARTCLASEVGCEGFTNLEEVARGGEGREFYSYLRACQKPDGSCANFYTWIGSETAGYELKRYFLRKGDDGGPFEILPTAIAEEIWGQCRNDPVNGPIDARVNPNCKEFYNENGEIFYRLYKNTITCHESCLQLRKNKPISSSACWPALFKDNDPIKNEPLIDGLSFSKTGGESCEVPLGARTCLTPSKEVCDLGKTCVAGGGFGGTTPSSCTCYTGTCTFLTLPQESVKCSATSDGCREYKGNNANNIKISFLDNFESGTVYPWRASAGSEIFYSNDSLYFGGHSLKVSMLTTGENSGETSFLKKNFADLLGWQAKAQGIPNLGAERDVAGLIFQGKSYLLSFLVKGVADNQKISIKFLPSNLNFPEVNISKEWQLINLGPIYFDKIPDPAEKIEITSGSTFWLDYIQLRDTGSLYLIRNFWITPSTCNDENDNPVMVGCAEYRDRENRAHYLKSFSQLCAEEAIGCEALINTQNSSLPFEERFNNDKTPSTDDVIVPADQTEYLIYDKNFSCQATDKGCQKFGSPALVDGKPTTYDDVFLKNDPDFYQTRPILCRETQMDCEEFTVAGGGSAYFKNPGEKQCQWKEKTAERSAGWFKQETEQPCYPDYFKNGVYDIKLYKENGYQGYAGLCPEKEVGCKSFTDSLMTAELNYVQNGDFKEGLTSWSLGGEGCQLGGVNQNVCKIDESESGGNPKPGLSINVSSPRSIPIGKTSLVYNVGQNIEIGKEEKTTQGYRLTFDGKISSLAAHNWAGVLLGLNYEGIKNRDDLNKCSECSDWQEYKKYCGIKGDTIPTGCPFGETMGPEECCRQWVENFSPRNCQFNRNNLKACIANLIDIGNKPWNNGEGLSDWAWNYEHGYTNNVNINLDSSKNTWQHLSLMIEPNPSGYPLESINVQAILSPPRWAGCDLNNNNECNDPWNPANNNGGTIPWQCCSAAGTVYFDNFELKPLDSYYLLDNFKLDKGSCNGQVSLENGCVLFYNENFGEPIYNSVATYAKSQEMGGALVKPVDCSRAPFNLPPTQVQPGQGVSWLKKIFSFFFKETNAQTTTLGVSCSQSPYKDTDYCKYCYAKGQTANDTNLILKVSSTRVCGEWLHCNEVEKKWQKEINDYIETCKSGVRCQRQIGQGKESTCAAMIQTSNEVLTKEKYQQRDTSWFSLEPAGYSLYKMRPIEKLSTDKFDINIGETGGTTATIIKDQLMLTSKTYCDGDSDCPTGINCVDQRCEVGVSGICQSDADCPAGARCLGPFNGSSNKICLIPLTPQAYPEKDAPFRPETSKVFQNINVCERGFIDCSLFKDAASCESADGISGLQGGAGNESTDPCWWNPERGECVVHCEYNKLFHNQSLCEKYSRYYACRWQDGKCGHWSCSGRNSEDCNNQTPYACWWNGSNCIERTCVGKLSKEECESHTGCVWDSRLNSCRNQNPILLEVPEKEASYQYFACQGDYLKAEYGAGGGIKKYFNLEENVSWPGVCLAGDKNRIGKPCNSNNDCGPTNGQCELLTKETIYHGRNNFCLLQDTSRPKDKSGKEIINACLTWYPFTHILQPTVETNSATEVTATKAKLNGTLSSLGAASAAKVWFEYKKANEDWPTNPKRYGEKTITSPGTSFNYTFPLNALSPSTTYHFRAVAENTHGISYGKVLSFTTTARPEFNFTLRYESTGNLIPPGGNTDLHLIVDNVPGEAESQTVTFSFSVQPPENGNANDITFNPTQPSCSAGNGQTSCDVTVTISASENAVVGDYQITITGTALNGKGGSVSKTTRYTLTVGGSCEGTPASCSSDEKCNEGGRSEFTCEGEKPGRCGCSPTPPEGCFKDDDCPNFSCGTCHQEGQGGQGRFEHGGGWICIGQTPGAESCCTHSNCSEAGFACHRTTQNNYCYNQLLGTCGPVPPVCDENTDCPPNMTCSWVRP